MRRILALAVVLASCSITDVDQTVRQDSADTEAPVCWPASQDATTAPPGPAQLDWEHEDKPPPPRAQRAPRRPRVSTTRVLAGWVNRVEQRLQQASEERRRNLELELKHERGPQATRPR